MVEKYSISEKKRLEQIFTSKSNVLKFLENKIKFSKIEKNYDFTIEQWNENKKIIIKEISEKFLFHANILFYSALITILRFQQN